MYIKRSRVMNFRFSLIMERRSKIVRRIVSQPWLRH